MLLNCNSKMDVKKNIRNDLMKRQEFVAELESEKNPNFSEVRKLIAEESGKPEENVDVRGVNGNFGKKVFTIDAYIYDSKEDLDNMKKLEITSKERKEGAKPVEGVKEESDSTTPESNTEQNELLSPIKSNEPSTSKSSTTQQGLYGDAKTDNSIKDEGSESGEEKIVEEEKVEASAEGGEEKVEGGEGEVPVEEKVEEEEVKEEESKEA